MEPSEFWNSLVSLRNGINCREIRMKQFEQQQERFGKDRMVRGKIYKPLEILGTYPRMTKVKEQESSSEAK